MFWLILNNDTGVYQAQYEQLGVESNGVVEEYNSDELNGVSDAKEQDRQDSDAEVIVIDGDSDEYEGKETFLACDREGLSYDVVPERKSPEITGQASKRHQLQTAGSCFLGS